MIEMNKMKIENPNATDMFLIVSLWKK